MNANQITTVETFGIETLDKAINSAVQHMSGTKNLAIDFLNIRELASGTDKLKTYKFPALIERIFKGQYDGSTAYKYAQCAEMFSEQPDIWDFFSISKLQILMNCENSAAKKKGMSAYGFLVWYADSINRAKNERVKEWEAENEKLLSKIEEFESVGDTFTGDMLREKLTPAPETGFDIPEKGTDAYKEYEEFMFTSARKVLSSVTDVILRDLVKVYKGADGYTLNTVSGKPEKEEVKKEAVKPEKASATPEQLKEEAHSALLAYTSTFDKVPKTLANALDYLAKGGEK